MDFAVVETRHGCDEVFGFLIVRNSTRPVEHTSDRPEIFLVVCALNSNESDPHRSGHQALATRFEPVRTSSFNAAPQTRSERGKDI
jgi:hypothetical protein